VFVKRISLLSLYVKDQDAAIAFYRDTLGFFVAEDLPFGPMRWITITVSAFEGTPLDIALRDCGVTSFVIVGGAMEIGIEPTVRHGADLGYIPSSSRTRAVQDTRRRRRDPSHPSSSLAMRC
jgi:nicotinamidase-related amidase